MPKNVNAERCSVDKKERNRLWMREHRKKIRGDKPKNKCAICSKLCEKKYCCVLHRKRAAYRRHYQKYFKAN